MFPVDYTQFELTIVKLLKVLFKCLKIVLLAGTHPARQCYRGCSASYTWSLCCRLWSSSSQVQLLVSIFVLSML